MTLSRMCASSLCSASLLALSLIFSIARGEGHKQELDKFRQRPPQDEVIYFLLPDRFENGDVNNDLGGLQGGRLQTGFDPTHKGFYHGGDLRGVIKRLDYIQSLGITAIWLAPIFKNKPVQGPHGDESAGYHGYWITDFTHVDPHFGTNEEFQELVNAVHARGMKLYMDIVVNHTADVIQYRECSDCPYRSHGEYPYTRRGGVDGTPINEGFQGDDATHQTKQNFSHLARADFAYTPFVPDAEAHVKVPEWLNDPIYYHNRGNSTFENESSTFGDFVGLDDLMTEHPQVLQGFIDIYGAWIDRYGIDGFRIDTARHVNPEFWQAFVPAMRKRAEARGIPNFHIFGEIATSEFDPAALAWHTRVPKLPAVLDFGFQTAVRDVVAGNKGTNELATLFADDVLYEAGVQTAWQLPTFVSNHDAGRFAYFVQQRRPNIDSHELQQRVTLAYAMLLTLRGVPTIYYGDEQGFVGLGNDQASRQDMFASKVASYNDQALIGTSNTTATSSFEHHSELHDVIATLIKLRLSHPALLHGKQVIRKYSEAPGVFAVSRIDSATAREIVVAFNTANTPVDTYIEVNVGSTRFNALHGECAQEAAAPGSYHIKLAALDYIICDGGANQ